MHAKRLIESPQGLLHVCSDRCVVLLALFTLSLMGTSCNRKVFQPQSAAQDQVSLDLVGVDVDQLDWSGVVDRTGKNVTADAEPDTPLILSFIYTRCPMETMCPMAVANLKAVTDKLEAQHLSGKVVLFSIDPAFDSPAVLSEYAEAQGLSADRWSLWTGSKEAFARITERFGITAEGESGAIMHNMRTMVIDADHVVKWVYRGGALPSQEIVAAVEHLQP